MVGGLRGASLGGPSGRKCPRSALRQASGTWGIEPGVVWEARTLPSASSASTTAPSIASFGSVPAATVRWWASTAQPPSGAISSVAPLANRKRTPFTLPSTLAMANATGAPSATPNSPMRTPWSAPVDPANTSAMPCPTASDVESSATSAPDGLHSAGIVTSGWSGRVGNVMSRW